MTFKRRWMTGLAGLMLSLGALAAPMEVGGIKLDDPVDVHGSKLQLNGAGIRYKAIFKVYVAALYLGKKAATPEEVYAATGPRRISITLLREIDSNELGKSFTKAFEENTPKTEMSKLIPGLVKMGQIFSEQKKMVAGESFTIDWVPDSGTVISVKGKPQGEPIKEVEFFNAMMRIWLGPQPADGKLKEQLLGKAS
ncbi:Chalcone isomerase-like [Polaromonas sp. OV174]|uniref:chalcone isomerase family protein n=1 Tax=Polaromonas sp. OV174 TaxID=1855300 RepID=UPI0008E3C7ED|nr:chalcone isomerase family protein [Polaromonas sp. OV174]SFC79128.1 Chalcone isomerase-like [Polaromonas sp. OV174]